MFMTVTPPPPNVRKQLLGLMAAATLPLVASAQSGPSDVETALREEQTEPLEHVLVYGNKIQRSYLETFNSVGVLTEEDLRAYDIADTSAAYLRMANVRAFTQGAGSKSISIRGLNADGITQPANSAALISVVIDGVTQSAEGLKRGSRGLWDVNQLEVHRGPKSTTQGRNALAGAVIIKTNDPSFDPQYNFRIIAGELDRREFAAALSGPIIDDVLAYRVSAEYAEKTSDIDFAYKDNERFGEDEYHNIRGKLLYSPESMEQLQVLLTVSDVFDSPASSPVTGPDFFKREFASDSAFAEFREMDASNYSADISYRLTDDTVLRSTTSYYASDLAISSPANSESFFRDDHREDGDLTQEFRVEMHNDTLGLSGVAGVFYGDFEQDTRSAIRYSGLIIQDGTFNNHTETWAAYVDLRYALGAALDLMFGGRYQKDSIGQAADYYSGIRGSDNVYDQKTNLDVFLPSIGLSYALTERQTLGITARKGYRQGFAEVSLGSQEALVDVDPEYVWSYDLAYRVLSADGRLQLGANLFYNDYRDQQVPVVNEEYFPLVNTLNAGDSTAYGLELESQYAFDNGIFLYSALGLVKTELGEFNSTDCAVGDCEGNSYSEAPELTASIGGEYKHQSGLFVSVAGSYTGSYFRNIDNSDDLKVDSYYLLNASLGYDFERFSVRVHGNNLFNEKYLTGSPSPEQAYIGDERNVSLEISADF